MAMFSKPSANPERMSRHVGFLVAMRGRCLIPVAYFAICAS